MTSDGTRSSLLIRIRDRKDAVSWREFAYVCDPVVRAFARKVGLPEQELDDVAQDVLVAVAEEIATLD